MRHLALLACLALAGCPSAPDGPFEPLDPHFAAHGCWILDAGDGVLARQGDGYGFGPGPGTPLYAQPADLGVVLLYDADGGYVVAEGNRLGRQTELESDVTTFEDDYVSGAEWALETSVRDPERYQLRARANNGLMTVSGLSPDEALGAPLAFVPAEGCAPHPELALNAEGAVEQTTWEDGDLFGFADIHTHAFTNYGFGGGMFHGAPFHPLGVEHALGSCEAAHGVAGKQDFFGYVYDSTDVDDAGFTDLIGAMLAGELPFDNHATDGYPTFSEWPDVRHRSTHQGQYHVWIERAWLAGLRLVVQHATTNSVICTLAVGEGWSPSRYDCDDMTAVDRQIEAAYAMERYIDAQNGGPGEGWYRVVTSPAQAREVVAAGKLAVVLGIEVSDLFDCPLTPRPGSPVCDADWVDSQLDEYAARGVTVFFPNHKYDNAFTPGDGQGGFIEMGNFLHSGHKTNKVTDDCPDVPPGYDHGPVEVGGLLEPRDDYLAPPTEDVVDFPARPLDTILSFGGALLSGPVEGDFCQNATMTAMGEHLLRGMMERGLLFDVDHLPRHSYARAYELMAEADYPAVGSHRRSNRGQIFETGGLTNGTFDRCHGTAVAGAAMTPYLERLAETEAAGAYPGIPLSLDTNGFAFGPRPRFGDEGCASPQENEVTYPFTSYAGDVTLTEPWAGERLYDFNTEGMAHIGLLPEFVQDLRLDGATDEELEPLFRSAEAFVRTWERAVARSEELAP